MGIYLINTAVFVYMMFYVYSRESLKQRKNRLLCCIWMLQFGLIAIFRAESVGTDLPTYKAGFEEIIFQGNERITSRSWEPGYVFLNKISGILGNHFFVLTALCSIITVSIVVYQTYKISYLAPLCLYFYVTLVYYYASFNMVRQSLAMAISLIGFQFIKERNLLKYIAVVAIACLFHASAIILIPLYFLANITLTPRFLYISIGGTAIVLIFIKEMFKFAISMLGRYDSYLVVVQYLEGRSGINIILPGLIFIVAYILKDRLIQLDIVNKKLISISFFALLISCLQLRIGVLERLSHYYNFFNIYLIAQFPLCFYEKKQKIFVILIIMACALAYNLFVFYMGFHEVLPYRTFICF